MKSYVDLLTKFTTEHTESTEKNKTENSVCSVVRKHAVTLSIEVRQKQN